jgi:hypothetical protein
MKTAYVVYTERKGYYQNAGRDGISEWTNNFYCAIMLDDVIQAFQIAGKYDADVIQWDIDENTIMLRVEKL